MLKGDKVCLFVTAFLYASLCSPSKTWVSRQRDAGWLSFLLPPAAPQGSGPHMEQEVSLVQPLLHAGRTAKSHSVIWVVPFKL